MIFAATTKHSSKRYFLFLEEISANPTLYENISFVQLAQNAGEEVSVIHLHELQQYMENYKRR